MYYSCPFQALEQERHGLHLKLENLEGEYENTVKELQYDISQLREELDRNRHETYAGEKDRINRIQDLTQQVRVKIWDAAYANSLIAISLSNRFPSAIFTEKFTHIFQEYFRAI